MSEAFRAAEEELRQKMAKRYGVSVADTVTVNAIEHHNSVMNSLLMSEVCEKGPETFGREAWDDFISKIGEGAQSYLAEINPAGAE